MGDVCVLGHTKLHCGCTVRFGRCVHTCVQAAPRVFTHVYRLLCNARIEAAVASVALRRPGRERHHHLPSWVFIVAHKLQRKRTDGGGSPSLRN